MKTINDMKAIVNTCEHPLIIRKQININRYITIANGKIIANADDSIDGFSIKMQNGLVSGFASAPISMEVKLLDLCNRAKSNLCDISDKMEWKRTTSSDFVDEKINETKTLSGNMEEKIYEFDYILNNIVDNNVERSISLVTYYVQKDMVVTDKCVNKNYQLVSFLLLQISLEENDKKITINRLTGWNGNVEDANRDAITSFFKESYCMLQDRKNTVPVKAGKKDIILSCKMTGILVHEAIGHIAEADNILAGSVAKNLLGKKVCSSKINITDFANHYRGKELAVPIYYDDEGNKAQDVEIIKSGIFTQLMTDYYTSYMFKINSSGNARASVYSDQPLVRMRNTAMLPGDDDIFDMVASIQDGYYIADGVSGQSDLSGDFNIIPSVVYEIKNGKIGKAVESCRLTGNCFDVLNSISMVSNRFDWYMGMCMKEQELVVSNGGPDIKCVMQIGEM